MKKLLTALVLAVLLCACAAPTAGQKEYLLYFASTATNGPALLSEPYFGENPPGPGELLRALLAGPAREGRISPFPDGVVLRGWSQEDGVLTVNLSEQYAGLTDISLTLADYCIVLTLGQLEGVDTVEITVADRIISYRSHQILSPDEVELNSGSLAEGVDKPLESW